MRSLLSGPLRVINVGLSAFARDLAANGVPAVQVDWSPPRQGMAGLLSRIASIEERIGRRTRRRCRACWLPSRCSPTCAAPAS